MMQKNMKYCAEKKKDYMEENIKYGVKNMKQYVYMKYSAEK